MTVGIVGLGLIGGSLAKAFKRVEETTVLGYDIEESTVLRAVIENAITAELTDDNIGECDFLFVALYPKATIDFIQEKADKIKKSCVVLDTCGTKRSICSKCFDIAKAHGFHFIGAHPMAGKQFSGFKYSKASMFEKASIILVPDKCEKLEVLASLKQQLVKAGFGSVTISTGSEHDRIIAFTSQLAHIVSNAYVKSPNAALHKGFSAGSYRDLTRVAKLNPQMWAELFLDNSDNITAELDSIIRELGKYRDAIKENDEEKLIELLEEGTKLKESIG